MNFDTFIQIGAGAADRDSRADYRDWFTEYVKSRGNQHDNVILVEANPINIPELRKAWVEYPKAKILNLGITGEDVPGEVLKFYYAQEDEPHFQVTSAIEDHVLRHYPNSAIMNFSIPCLGINKFFKNYVNGKKISLLAIDVEGLDYEILMALDLEINSPRFISFEKIHASNADEVFNRLKAFGYSEVKNPWDYFGYDILFRKNQKFKIPRIDRILRKSSVQGTFG